jgi:Fe-S-cluster-containing dehydrogenase component
MELTRHEFLKKAWRTGLIIFGGASFELVSGASLAAGEQPAAAGKRLAMSIDVRACMKAGQCVKCIDACHRGHNVPAIPDVKHAITWIWRDDLERAMPGVMDSYSGAAFHGAKPVLLCNQCGNPPCVRVCPTGATWKRGDGIVMMDQHRCIGCRYCMAACPYGSRSFNWSDPRKFLAKKSINKDYPTRTKGTVEKCDFCAERVDRGLGPLCAAACAEKAITFGDLREDGSAVRKALAGRIALRRKPELGTDPAVYYLL